MNTHEITLDVSKEPSHEPTLYLGQGDMNGTTLVVNMFDNGEVLDLTGLSVKFCMRTPDMLDYYEVAGTASGNVATFIIDETYAAGHPGNTDIAYVQVIDGDTESTSTARMRVVVLPSAKEGVVPAPAYKSLIEEFLDEAQEEVDEAVAAAQAIVDYSVPLMSPTVRGGAKLGQGLKVDSETLSLGNLVESGTGAEVVTDGCAIYSVSGEGWATQDGTPTPDSPVEIKVARGRNLLPRFTTAYSGNGITVTPSDDGSILFNGTATANIVTGVLPFSSVSLKAGTYTMSLNNTSVPSGLTMRMPGMPDAANVSSTPKTVTLDGNADKALYFIILSGTVLNNLRVYPQLERGSTPTPYVPYGHVGLDVASTPALYKSGHAIPASGEESANSSFKILRALACGTGGMVDASVSAGSMTRVHAYDAHGNWISQLAAKDGMGTVTFAIPSTAYELRFSTPNSAALELTCTTAVPLPAKGFAASLPDGTADALAIDSAGRWEWAIPTAEKVLDGTTFSFSGVTAGTNNNGNRLSTPAISGASTKSDDRYIPLFSHGVGNARALDSGSWHIGDAMLFSGAVHIVLDDSITSASDGNTWLTTHNMTVLYPLATLTTESGYISDWPSEIPEGAVISCPELQSIGVSVFVPGAREIAQHVSNVYKRIEAALADVYEAIADL